MNISTDLDDISPDFNKATGGYEWWYFDGMSANGDYGFVIIFYHVNPFSTKYIQELDSSEINASLHPAISVSLYHKSKPVYYSFLEFDENDFSWSADQLKLKIGSDSVQYNITDNTFGFELMLNQKLASGHSIDGVISGEGGLPPSYLIHSKSDEKHLWNLVTPSMRFNADLMVDGRTGKKRVIFQGDGYHDHNIGQEPMKDSFRDWYWGRYHFEDATLIYYLMNKHQGHQFEGWLIDRQNQEVLAYFEEADLEYFSRNWFGLKSARKIELKKDQISVNIQCRDKIDDGPFYQRFMGDSVLNYNCQVHGAQGISEYICPENIYKKRFWPLIHMRLRYLNQKPHWVQKSHLLYPWTW